MERSLILVKHSRIYSSSSVDFQCKETGYPAYDYEIEVRVSPDKLDESDFIIDHTVIHEVIKEVIQQQMGSCERLCLRVEEAVLNKLKDHGTHVKAISLAIKPVDSNAWTKFVGEYGSSEEEIEREMYDWLNNVEHAKHNPV